MAIAFVNSAGLGNNGGSGNFSAAYSCAVDVNGLLVIGITAGGTDSVTSVTYGGNACTLAVKEYVTNNNWGYMYFLLNPPSGSNNVVINQTGGNFLLPVCSEYSGAGQSGQPDNTASNDSAGSNVTTLSQSITVIAANCWVVAVGLYQGGTPGMVSPLVQRSVGSFNTTTIGDTNGTVSAGANNLTVNAPVDPQLMGILLASFSPPAAPSSPSGIYFDTIF